MDVVGIVSNHPREALSLTGMDGILPSPAGEARDQAAQEAQIKQIIEETRPT
jgi:hypothetical protein